mmetsp:Transcript_126471/g.328470  ORF Transcript_126471/g.328470 Transcript_126471/m.328470 type:complete len:359 (+) Transcript_126471:57-1133(+)
MMSHAPAAAPTPAAARPLQPVNAEATVQISAPFPVRALVERMRLNEAFVSSATQWAGYLPENARTAELAQVSATTRLPRGSEDRSSSGGRGNSSGGGIGRDVSGAALSIAGRVWEMAQHPQGCREVQNRIASVSSDEQREALAMELQGHIRDAIKCPHANHVVQKCIVMLRPHAVQFVVDEIARAGLLATARHKYGCRILQRLIEHCSDEQVRPVVNELLLHFQSLCQHQYGNYVVTHLLEHATDKQQAALCMLIRQNVRILGEHPHGCAVLGAALTCDIASLRTDVARTILSEPSLIGIMASMRHGHVAVKNMLRLLEGDDYQAAVDALSTESLCSSRYGRLVAAHLGVSRPSSDSP